jgi:hypothetical protein
MDEAKKVNHIYVALNLSCFFRMCDDIRSCLAKTPADKPLLKVKNESLAPPDGFHSAVEDPEEITLKGMMISQMTTALWVRSNFFNMFPGVSL